MKQRFIRIAFMLACMLLLLPVQVFANSPPPKPWFEIVLCDLPQGTAYVDMLVYLPESDPFYTELEERNLPQGFSAQSEIVTYCEDDFRSYTFHYTDAKSAIGVKNTGPVYFFDNPNMGGSTRHAHIDDVKAKGEIRLALLDKEGTILHVSPTFRLETRTFLGTLDGDFVYNGADDTLETREHPATFFAYVGYALLAWLGLLLTCLTEWIVAWLLGLGPQNTRRVIRVNIVSQILMHTLYITFYSLIFWRYTAALILLELLVYAGEFICYRFWLMRDIPAKKCLIFVVIANTASLVLGMLMLRLLGILH